MPQTALKKTTTTSAEFLYLAFELSSKNWKVGMTNGVTDKVSEFDIPAGNLKRLDEVVCRGKSKLGLTDAARVRSCYEAGRDGFWLHRELQRKGWSNLVIDPSSLEVDRRARRKKTDRIDVRKELRALTRYHRGETEALRSVRVPTAEQEDARRDPRERQRLVNERTAHRNRIKSLVVLHGVVLKGRRKADVDKLRTKQGEPLPPKLLAELKREQQRLELVEEQVAQLDRERKERLVALHLSRQGRATKQLPRTPEEKVLALMQLQGIGLGTAWPLVYEFFFRTFENRKQVGSAAGFAPTPYDSGNSDREQGISKAGNARVRQLMVELAWTWLRLQPTSRLTLWFHQRFGVGKRSRRTGIVAMARKLLVDLWRYLETGKVPDGAKLKTTIKL